MAYSRNRSSFFEDLFDLATQSQKGAITSSIIGLSFLFDLPRIIIVDLFGAGRPVTQGVLGGIMAFLSPLLSIIGCLVMAYAGYLLITRSKKPSYLKTIKSKQASQAAGIVVLLLGGGSLLSTFADKSSQIEKLEPRYVSPTIPQAPTPIQLTQPPRVETPVRASQSNGLAYDTPFPANGKIERTLALTGNIAQMEIRNLSGQNMIAIWYYNTAVGDQEAARMYITAGQSAKIDLPTFDYRLAGLFANPELGMVRGFKPNQIPRDFGFIDLKRPARTLSSQPTLYVKTYGQKSFRPGYEKQATR